MALAITSETFEKEVLQSDKPVLVDFWASWCGPCRALSPVVDEVAEEIGDKVKVVKINVDDYPELASQYGVMSIPTLCLFQNGQVTDRSVGVVPKQKILDMVGVS